MYYRHTVLKISLPFTSPLKDLHRTQQEPYEASLGYASIRWCWALEKSRFRCSGARKLSPRALAIGKVFEVNEDGFVICYWRGCYNKEWASHVVPAAHRGDKESRLWIQQLPKSCITSFGFTLEVRSFCREQGLIWIRLLRYKQTFILIIMIQPRRISGADVGANLWK